MSSVNSKPALPKSGLTFVEKCIPPSQLIKAWRSSLLSRRPSQLITSILAIVMAIPLITLLWIAFTENGESFQHIKETVLTTYILNSVILLALVGLFVLVIGVPLAWLIAQCQFPGRRFFNWALVLPLSMPAYVVAYVYTDMLDFAGPIQTLLRDWFNWQTANDYWFVDIRTIPGAAVILSLVLYPYVYLLARASFMSQNATLIQAATMLGQSKMSAFFRITLPLARSAIVAGLALVLMEALADFATVKYFAVNTLTTAVYDTWLGHYDLVSAAKLSVIMVMAVFVLLYLEKVQSGQRIESANVKVSNTPIRIQLSKKQQLAAVTFCGLVFVLGFLLPAAVLGYYAVNYFDHAWSGELVSYTKNSIMIAAITACVAILLALLFNHIIRFAPSTFNKVKLQVASSGYAIPGTVMAIGVLIPLGYLDQKLNELVETLHFSAPGLILSGTIVAIITAHVMRFTAIANKGLESRYGGVSVSLDQAAQVLKLSRFQVLRRIHLPLLKPSILVAFLLIFVESMKELSAAILLRPFDFQTLPTYVYQYASDEQLEMASLGAIIICVVGLLPLIVLNRSIEQSRSEI